MFLGCVNCSLAQIAIVLCQFGSELVKLKFLLVTGTCYISSILQCVSYPRLLFMYQALR